MHLAENFQRDQIVHQFYRAGFPVFVFERQHPQNLRVWERILQQCQRFFYRAVEVRILCQVGRTAKRCLISVIVRSKLDYHNIDRIRPRGKRQIRLVLRKLLRQPGIARHCRVVGCIGVLFLIPIKAPTSSRY